MVDVQHSADAIRCPRCGRSDTIRPHQPYQGARLREFVGDQLPLSFILFSMFFPFFCTAACFLFSVTNLNTYDQQDYISLSRLGLFACGVPLALFWMLTSSVWVRTKLDDLGHRHAYFCDTDTHFFVVPQPVDRKYRALYSIAFLPLLTCLATFGFLKLTDTLSPTPPPFPGATPTVYPISSSGGSGGRYWMQSSTYAVAEPLETVRAYYEEQLPRYFLSERTFEQETYPQFAHCIRARGPLKRWLPYQFQSFSVMLCPQSDGQTEVHTTTTWNE